MELYHPAANIFPMMTDDEFALLLADIKANGLIEPIWFCDGQILDGRNRWKACEILGIAPEVKEYGGDDPIGFVVSLNLNRRHLNSSQRAIVGLEVEKAMAVEAKRRQGARNDLLREQDNIQELIPECSPQARDTAAAMVGTNGRYISDAKKLMQTAPELLSEIAAGNMTIPEAKREVKKRQQQERIKAQSEMEQAEITVTATIYHGNCFDHIKYIDDGTIAAAIIDPPYNVTGFDWDKIGSDAEFVKFTKSWLDAIRPKFKSNYHLFIFCDASYSADVEMLLRRDGWSIKSRIIWEYRNLVMGRDSTDKFIQNWQMCLHVGNGKLNWSQVWDDSRFAVQQFATPQSNFAEGKHHPHQKPLGLIENLIKAGSVKGDTILDIFAGSGTTGLAAINNNRNVILIEQSAEYISIIKDRLKVKE